MASPHGYRAKPRARGFGKGGKIRPGRYVMVGGKLTHIDDVEGALAKVRKRDSVGLLSVSCGCAVHQVDEFNRMYGGPGTGVHFDAQGNAHFKDRNTKLRHLKMRGFHDNFEVRG